VTTVRLLSYNIRSTRDDKNALIRVIRSARADVVCIQEAPRFLRWRSKLAELARRSGLVVVSGGRPAGSNLILSSLAVTVEATHDIKFTKDPRLDQRGTSIAVMSLSGSRFAVAGTHLDLQADARLRHVHELHATLDRLVPEQVPTIVAGDMNALPESLVWSALAAQRQDVWAAVGAGDGFTFRSTKPYERIDGVFAGPGITSISATVLASEDTRVATDHCPLLVELEVG
jgi:endonuclease/exonuclease/phosphatase family metal-dependent hydrolase